MADQYGIKVWLDLQVKDVKKKKKEIQDDLKDVDLTVNKKSVESIKSSLMKIANQFGGVIGTAMTQMYEISGKIPREVKSGGGIAKRAASGTSSAAAAGKEPAKEVAAGAGQAAGTAAAAGASTMAIGAGILAGVAGIIVVLKAIKDRVDKGVAKLTEASAAFSGTKDLMDKMWNKALAPIANMMAIMMRPYLTIALQYMKKRVTEMQKVIKAAGGNITPEVSEEITKIWEGTAEGMAYIYQQAMEAVKPIAAQVQGFTDATKIIYQDWVSSLGNWVTGFLDKLKSGLGGMPDDLAEFIMNEIRSNTGYLDKATKLKEGFYAWLLAHPENVPELPKKVSDEFFDSLLDRVATGLQAPPDTFHGMLTDFGGDIYTLLKKGAEGLPGAVEKFVNWLKGILGIPDETAKPTQELQWWQGNPTGNLWERLGLNTLNPKPSTETSIMYSNIDKDIKDLNKKVSTWKGDMGTITSDIKTGADNFKTDTRKNLTNITTTLAPFPTEVHSALKSPLPKVNTELSKYPVETHDALKSPLSKLTSELSKYPNEVHSSLTSPLNNVSSKLSGIGVFLWNAITKSISEGLSGFIFNWKFWWKQDTGHQTGLNYVPETGMYKLHEGEKVLNAPRAQRNESKTVTIAPTYNIYSSGRETGDIESMIRRTARALEFQQRTRQLL